MDELTAFAKTGTASRIRAAAARGALSHALILSGGNGVTAARYAAAAMECTASLARPCLSCAACRKVMGGIHPDVIAVRDEAHRELSAETVRAMRADAFIRPNEGARKVYLFEDCARLNEKDQNILLKLVEEGPPYAAFLFCAENASALLQTIRSRCVELRTGPADGSAVEEDGRVRELCRLSAEGSEAEKAAFLAALENAKPSREELGALFEAARVLLSEALAALYGKQDMSDAARQILPVLTKRLTKRQILGTIDLLDTYRKHCEYNVGVGVLLGGFAAEWEKPD